MNGIERKKQVKWTCVLLWFRSYCTMRRNLHNFFFIRLIRAPELCLLIRDTLYTNNVVISTCLFFFCLPLLLSSLAVFMKRQKQYIVKQAFMSFSPSKCITFHLDWCVFFFFRRHLPSYFICVLHSCAFTKQFQFVALSFTYAKCSLI